MCSFGDLQHSICDFSGKPRLLRSPGDAKVGVSARWPDTFGGYIVGGGESVQNGRFGGSCAHFEHTIHETNPLFLRYSHRLQPWLDLRRMQDGSVYGAV